VQSGRRCRKNASSLASRCQSVAFNNVGWSLLAGWAKTGNDEWHRQSATFEMPTAPNRTGRCRPAIAQNVRLTVGEVSPHVQYLVVQRQQLNPPSSRDSISLHWLPPTAPEPRQPTHATAEKFYPSESPTPHSRPRKQAVRMQHGRKPLVRCSIVDVHPSVRPATSKLEKWPLDKTHI